MKGNTDQARTGELTEPVDPAALREGLRIIRRRRWYLWGLILVYLPVMWTTLQLTRSLQASLPVFGVWFVLLLVIMTVSAVARCPRCGNYFHLHGMTLLYLRRCLHCQLPLNADKKLSRPP